MSHESTMAGRPTNQLLPEVNLLGFFMAKQDFSQFKTWCSEIHSLLVTPKGLKPKQQEYKKYDRLINSEDEKSEDELKFIQEFSERLSVLNDEPLGKTTISALIRQYGKIIFNKKIAATGDGLSFLKKGTDMEGEAIELLSKIDKCKYSLITDNIENEYILGRCDIFCPDKDKIIDTKVSWNVNAFLNARTTPLSKKYWYQMQGYMELYNVNKAEVVFLLLNTPTELIEREKVKLQNKFMIGEIDREKYELDVDNIESAFTYSNLPIKKRYFRYTLTREPQIFENIYKKVEKARIWLQQFHIEMRKNVFVVPSENYLKSEKNNTERDPDESLPSNAG